MKILTTLLLLSVIVTLESAFAQNYVRHDGQIQYWNVPYDVNYTIQRDYTEYSLVHVSHSIDKRSFDFLLQKHSQLMLLSMNQRGEVVKREVYDIGNLDPFHKCIDRCGYDLNYYLVRNGQSCTSRCQHNCTHNQVSQHYHKVSSKTKTPEIKDERPLEHFRVYMPGERSIYDPHIKTRPHKLLRNY